MTIANCLDTLLKLDYNVYHYTRNKAALSHFLNQTQKNEEKLTPADIQSILGKLKPVFKKLRRDQQKIHSQKSQEKTTSIFRPFLFKLTRVFHRFQQAFYGKTKLDSLTELAARIAKENRVPDANKKIQAVAKFKNLVKKLQHTIAVGTRAKDAVALDKDYWLETLGMKLIIEGEIYEGHIYTGYIATEEKYVEKWKTGRDEQGIFYHENYSFEDYMNQVVIPCLSTEQKATFKAKLSIVEYYTANELTTLEAHFDKEGRMFTKSPSLNAWVDHKAKNPNSTLSYQESHLSSEKRDGSGKEQHILKDQTYIYVLDHQGRLYLQIKNRGKTNHTSLSNGHAVLAAGSLKVKDGKVIAVDTFSGHYKPTEVQLMTFLNFLKKSHVNLSQIKVTYVGDYAVQPWQIHEINCGDVIPWMDKRQA